MGGRKQQTCPQAIRNSRVTPLPACLPDSINSAKPPPLPNSLPGVGARGHTRAKRDGTRNCTRKTRWRGQRKSAITATPESQLCSKPHMHPLSTSSCLKCLKKRWGGQ
ncbi:Hypothetical predicted protein [Podarcis lilfordi]|uniref:Uncharacterized protein n=1 Tax=Podarcis lilfordi TaxID=74358 RepID=A0AA35K1R3_9SAUR|nr:Hypothetical predicted protein [Podarcis lilfordi]